MDLLSTYGMFRRVKDRLIHGSSSVQYELQRRTFRGGWKNFYADSDVGESAAFDTPLDPPDINENPLLPPGQYRCIKRVDGKIANTEWNLETPDAEAFYRDQQKEANQREELEAMSTDEIRTEIENRTELPALDPPELVVAFSEKVAERKKSESDRGEFDTELRDSLVRGLLDEEGVNAAMEAYQQVRRAEMGLCAHCTSQATERCSDCGEFVCLEHSHSQYGACSRSSGPLISLVDEDNDNSTME